jgi:hypothetical protein
MYYVNISYILGFAGMIGIFLWVKWQKRQMKRFLDVWFK